MLVVKVEMDMEKNCVNGGGGGDGGGVMIICSSYFSLMKSSYR